MSNRIRARRGALEEEAKLTKKVKAPKLPRTAKKLSLKKMGHKLGQVGLEVDLSRQVLDRHSVLFESLNLYNATSRATMVIVQLLLMMSILNVNKQHHSFAVQPNLKRERERSAARSVSGRRERAVQRVLSAGATEPMDVDADGARPTKRLRAERTSSLARSHTRSTSRAPRGSSGLPNAKVSTLTLSTLYSQSLVDSVLLVCGLWSVVCRL